MSHSPAVHVGVVNCAPPSAVKVLDALNLAQRQGGIGYAKYRDVAALLGWASYFYIQTCLKQLVQMGLVEEIGVKAGQGKKVTRVCRNYRVMPGLTFIPASEVG